MEFDEGKRLKKFLASIHLFDKERVRFDIQYFHLL